MRNPILKKILALDEAFDKARKAQDIAAATKISAQMNFLEPSLTPREHYRYLTAQMMKFTTNSMREIDHAAARIYNGKDIQKRIETAKLILASLHTHYNTHKIDDNIVPGNSSVPPSPTAPR